jgi:hypothetical protein
VESLREWREENGSSVAETKPQILQDCASPHPFFVLRSMF